MRVWARRGVGGRVRVRSRKRVVRVRSRDRGVRVGRVLVFMGLLLFLGIWGWWVVVLTLCYVEFVVEIV